MEKIKAWYQEHKEEELSGRYLPLSRVLPVYERYISDPLVGFEETGKSENEKPIHILSLGKGKKKVLMWSQMHGNETTTTKAVFDLLKFLTQKDFLQPQISGFLETYSLYIIPILNPDGAEVYSRLNYNQIDLNRDAKELSQRESKVLRRVFDKIQPDLCLNLHDQRTIFGLKKKYPATISFLSPASDPEKVITPSRKEAMKDIVKMNSFLQHLIPNQVGRYDDKFNDACFGDSFQKENIPVILFEAGHYPGDYQREKTRELIFYSFLSLFDILPVSKTAEWNEYHKIPENEEVFRDILLRNVVLEEEENPVDVSIQFTEVLEEGKVQFQGFIKELENNIKYKGHLEIDGNQRKILIKAKNSLKINVKMTDIVNKGKETILYFE